MQNKATIISIGLIGLLLSLAGCGGNARQESSAASQTKEWPPQTAAGPDSNPDSNPVPEAVDLTDTATTALTKKPEKETVTTSTTNIDLPRRRNPVPAGDVHWNQLLARDAIYPVYSPKFTDAGSAPYSDDELVIGVEINGEAKAYAIGPLNSREMVNDTVGGTPVLVSW